MQTFTAPVTGNYKLEVWGAEGGLTSQARLLNMGKGGYSVGSINLPQDKLLYIFVGGKGNMGLKNNGGYNGGGHNEDIGNYNVPGGGGGGMSHISFEENPVLSNETWNPNGTIIVAGGGGGNDDGKFLNSSLLDIYAAGSGGGYKGKDAFYTSNNLAILVAGTGGNTTIVDVNYNEQGRGQSSINADAGAGGGGWYGGRTPDYHDGGGAGGSGYIGHPSLTNKHMAGYHVETSNDVDTKTISVSVSSSNPIADYAKDGDGYAIITWFPLTL